MPRQTFIEFLFDFQHNWWFFLVLIPIFVTVKIVLSIREQRRPKPPLYRDESGAIISGDTADDSNDAERFVRFFNRFW